MTTLTPLAIQAASESFLAMSEADVIQKNLNIKLVWSSENNEMLEIHFSIIAANMPEYLYSKFFRDVEEKTSLLGVLNFKATYNKCSLHKDAWVVSKDEGYITPSASSGYFLELFRLTASGNDSHKSEDATRVELSDQQQLRIAHAYLSDLNKNETEDLTKAVLKKTRDKISGV